MIEMLWFSKVDSSRTSASSVSVWEWENWKGRLDNMGGAGVQRQHAFGVLLRRCGRKKFFENGLHLQAKNQRFQAIFMIIARPSQDKQNNPR